ncbi:T9SS type B sorting domain-containing protein [Ekhidna sp.]
MRKLLYIIVLIPCWLGAQLYIPNSSLVHISDGANLEVGGELQNRGIIQNEGTLSLYGNWLINNNFNGLIGTLQFLGDSTQMVGPPELTISGLVINQGGEVMFPGDEYTILDRLELRFGNIKPGDDTRFVLGPTAEIFGGSNTSYFDGTLISRGSGIKTFPVGSDGVHAPITLLNVFGFDTEIAATFLGENSSDPIPGDSLLGVSHKGLWEVELLSGTTDPTRIAIDFNNEDLNDFRVKNDIRHRISSPVIAYSDNPTGIFQSLGVNSLVNTDSITFGSIASQLTVRPIRDRKIYLALALAPQVPDEGLYFIPQAFSPQASDPKNQTFRIFGQQVAEEGFALQIYNRYGVLVYSTSSFAEANQRGWDGISQQTGASEPAGVFYYTIRLQFETGLPVEEKGAFYLVK